MESSVPRTPYPSDVSDEEWTFVSSYLTLMTPDAPQRRYPLREVYNALRWIVRTGAQVGELAEAVQDATGDQVEIAFVDQGYTGAAATHRIDLVVVKHDEARQGFVLLPRRWVVERDFAWASRFRRLVRDYECLPETVAGLHFVAFACLMVYRLVTLAAQSP